MRQKIVLRRRAVPLHITLPNGTSFAARYKRISRNNLPGNIRVIRTHNIGPPKRRTKNKKMRFLLANTPIQDRAKRIKKKYRKLWDAGIGRGRVGNLATAWAQKQ